MIVHCIFRNERHIGNTLVKIFKDLEDASAYISHLEEVNEQEDITFFVKNEKVIYKAII